MKADVYFALKYCVNAEALNLKIRTDEAYLAGFEKAREMAKDFCAQLNNPGMAILIGAMATAEVDPKTGKPIGIDD